MFYAYILKSIKDGRYYYGHTGELQARLVKHNSGSVESTKGRRPLVLHYKEEFLTKSEAAKREHFFKSIPGYLWLKSEKNYLKIWV